MTETPKQFQPEETLRALSRHGVRYVLIGGLAAVIHGSPYFRYLTSEATTQALSSGPC